ncbi:sigma-70 family RNA polymerase sigma factor [Actinoplanes sp. NPDC049596]|uniref:sigma-70 family RNA polymerase sigma factor n=1 Tax=unclassified Actinoplanes TaxID=2626549 RepID=UPI0034332CD8
MDVHERFEANRPRLRAVAHRMLGSTTEADDAVQEAWLRLDRTGTDKIDNLDAWLTTVVGRVCLDMLRSRATRREDTYESDLPAPAADPEQQTVLADSVGLALMVVLETLSPVERLAFVLHDLFAVPFDEIAPVVGRSPDAARQLASRARRRIQSQTLPATEQARLELATDSLAKRDLVDAFLAASRSGDFVTLLSLLDPDVRLRVDDTARQFGAPATVQGSTLVAQFFSGRATAAITALIDGAVGIAVAPHGKTRIAVMLTFGNNRITTMTAIADPTHLAALTIEPA